MPLRITSAPVSGIKKRKSVTTPRTRASPFASHARSKPSVRGNAQAKSNLQTEGGDGDGCMSDSEPLPDIGSSQYVTELSMFEELPERRAGMNSTRIAAVLNVRKSLPPLVSVAHIHTVLQAPTQVEREIVSLVQSGQLKRLIVPGRGNGAAGLGDCLVMASDLHELVQMSSDLDQALKDRFLSILDQMSNTSAIPSLAFSREESISLVRAGFLVTASSLSKEAVNLTSDLIYAS
uniref:Uncharacterized protein n=1 Tax=Talaromyces marneffei PM1 TaxID=1077442 RepID=A0A093UWH3_TALMA